MKVTVQKKDTLFSFDLEAGESLLYAGLRQGLALPYECATGTCGSCRARLVNGKLDPGWPQAPGRSYLKPERDEFLMCQAQAHSDCEIRVPGSLTQFAENNIVPAHYSGTINSIHTLTHDVLRFEVSLVKPMSFQAGQFVVIDTPDVKGFRAYSMINYEDQTEQLEFVIKRLPDGKFSDWVFDTVENNATVSVFGPLGSATFDPQEDQDILCIAGGSGIAGMMSILTRACRDDYFADHRGQLFFGVRTNKDIFFLNELSEFTKQFPETLIITLAFSEQSVAQNTNLPSNLVFTTGFVHEVARQTDLNPDGSLAYIAGPPPMVDATLRDLMLEVGFAATQIRYDKFS